MRKNKSQTPVTTIGVPSLLVVFIILCLVTFACLSLSTAKSNYSYSEANAAHKTEYYNACNKAEEFVHDINTGKQAPVTKWSVAINNKQALKVRIGPSNNADTAEGSNSYEITAWQVVSTVKHDYNQNMILIK